MKPNAKGMEHVMRTWVFLGILGSILIGGCGDSDSSSFGGNSWWDENAPLAVSNVSPSPGATSADICGNVVIFFNKPLDPATATNTTVAVVDSISTPIVGAVTCPGPDFRTVTFNPTSDFTQLASYQVTLTSGLTAADGETLTPTTFQFTAADFFKSTASNPSNGAIDVPINATTITVTLNKAADGATVLPADFTVNGSAPSTASASGNTITLTMGSDFPISTVINVLLVGTVQTDDACSETLSSSNFDFSFTTGTTGDSTPPTFTSQPSIAADNAIQATVSGWTATDAGSGLASYNVYRSTSSMLPTPAPGFLIASGLSTGTTTHQNSNTGDPLTESTTYFYIIGAVDAVGNEGFSNEVSVTTPGKTSWTTLFTTYIASPIGASLACAACHTGGGAAGGLDLSTQILAYSNMFNVQSNTGGGSYAEDRVDDFDHANSVLWQKLAGIGAGALNAGQMPDDGPDFIDATGLGLFEDWINEGAEDN